MRYHIATVLVICLLLFSACIRYNRAININTVRIEDIDINKLLNAHSNIKNLRAEWSGKTVDLYYDVSDGAVTTGPLSYASKDEYAYSYNGPNAFNTSASILSVNDNTEITWDEFSDLENPCRVGSGT